MQAIAIASLESAFPRCAPGLGQRVAETHGFAQVFLGLLPFSLLLQCHAHLVMSEGVFRRSEQGFLQCLNAGVYFALLQLDFAFQDQRFGVLRRAREHVVAQ